MKNKIDNKAMGRRIRIKREALGKTRDKLAEEVDVSSKFIQDIEYGIKGMSIETLAKMSDALELSADYILKGFVNDEKEDIERQTVKNNIIDTLNSYDNNSLKVMDQVCRLLVSGKITEENDEK